MGLRFTVLASGSAGNASLVEADGFGVLIDAGLGPRQLATRLAAADSSWLAVRAVLLTHTHSDHWKELTLGLLRRRGILLYSHPDCHSTLSAYSSSFPALLAEGLVRPFEAGTEFALSPGLRCRPLSVRHDGGVTFGFRLEGTPDLFGRAAALGYVADLGCWDEALAAALADVDLLAVEFNHDVAMEMASGRTPRLIQRVLGDEGHLSNAQGAGLVRAVLARSEAGRLQHLVQLHLSRDCNRPLLAREAARSLLAELGVRVEVHTAQQDLAGACVHLGDVTAKRRPARRTATSGRTRRRKVMHPWLPGLEDAEEPQRGRPAARDVE